MSKYAIDEGHLLNGFDTGAVGIGNEGLMNRQVGEIVIAELQALGHEVINVTPISAISLQDSLQQRVDKANNSNVDLYVALHENAGGGQGTEIWAGGSQKSIDVAHNVLDAIVATGFNNRGVKIQGQGYEHLYVLNNTNAPAILVEGCFVDSASDMSKWNAKVEAEAIVKGITGQVYVAPPVQPIPVIKPQPKSVQASNVNQRVLAYQKAFNTLGLGSLDVDGILGTFTLRSVDKLPMVQIGSKNDIVGWIQGIVGCGQDNDFGKITKAAVIKYQSNTHYLVVDGVAGHQTINYMLTH
jgi:N-acetylmuramoyl-L-alanine amidase